MAQMIDSYDRIFAMQDSYSNSLLHRATKELKPKVQNSHTLPRLTMASEYAEQILGYTVIAVFLIVVISTQS